MNNFLKFLVLFVFSYDLFALELQHNTMIKLFNGDFKCANSLRVEDEVCVLDENGNEQTAEIENISSENGRIFLDIVDYDNIVTKDHSIFHRKGRSFFLGNVDIRKIKSGIKIPKSGLFAIVVFSLIDAADGGPVAASLCPGICPIVLSAGCSPLGQSVIIAAIGRKQFLGDCRPML